MTSTGYLDNLNYVNDPRVRGADRAAGVPLTLTYEDDDGDLITDVVPHVWDVCGVCEGTGTHVNPSIDAGGLSSDMEQDFEFMDDYRSGAYDVVCQTCHGRTTIPVIDESRVDPDVLRLHQEYCQSYADDAAYERAERAMGC